MNRKLSLRLSARAKEFIEANYETVSTADLSKRFNVNENAVINFIKKLKPDSEDEDRGIFRQKLLRSVHWKQIKQQFSAEELDKFQELYINFMLQFKQGVLSTEESQIFQIITTEILIDRNLIEKQKSQETISRYERDQRELLKEGKSNFAKMSKEDRDFLVDLEMKIGVVRNADQARTSEFVKLQEKHAALMKDLKGTREQRIKEIESGKTTFIDLVKVLQHQEAQSSESRNLELFKMASDKEKVRLAKAFKFEDNIVEPMILNDESVNNIALIED